MFRIDSFILLPLRNEAEIFCMMIFRVGPSTSAAVTLRRKRKTEIILILATLNWDPYSYEEAMLSIGYLLSVLLYPTNN